MSEEPYQPPEWVNKGSGAFKDVNEKVFYGVGLADGMKNLSLQRTTADDRAIANLATQMSAVVKRLKKDYESITAAGPQTTERENVDNAMKLLVNETVNGARIIDHWEHPGKNVLYALARIELYSSKCVKNIFTRVFPMINNSCSIYSFIDQQLHCIVYIFSFRCLGTGSSNTFIIFF